MKILLVTLFLLASVILIATYCCYRMAFHVKRVPVTGEIEVPEGEIYEVRKAYNRK